MEKRINVWRNDRLAWVFGAVFGGGLGYLAWLLTVPAVRMRLWAEYPEPVLGVLVKDALPLLVYLTALLLVPTVTILLARRRVFSLPLLPLVLFIVPIVLSHFGAWEAFWRSLRVMLPNGVLFFLLAWIPFSRTSLLDGGRGVAKTKSCGPRALYLACHALNLPVTLPQVRRATKLTAQGTTLSHLERAAGPLGLAMTHLPPENIDASVQPSAPALALVNWGGSSENHAVVVLAAENDRVLIHDPNYAWEKWIPAPRLKEALLEDLLRVTRLDPPLKEEALPSQVASTGSGADARDR